MVVSSSCYLEQMVSYVLEVLGIVLVGIEDTLEKDFKKDSVKIFFVYQVPVKNYDLCKIDDF